MCGEQGRGADVLLTDLTGYRPRLPLHLHLHLHLHYLLLLLILLRCSQVSRQQVLIITRGGVVATSLSYQWLQGVYLLGATSSIEKSTKEEKMISPPLHFRSHTYFVHPHYRCLHTGTILFMKQCCGARAATFRGAPEPQPEPIFLVGAGSRSRSRLF